MKLAMRGSSSTTRILPTARSMSIVAVASKRVDRVNVDLTSP